ncbi:endonuclease domain-containing protein [Microbacterium sp. NPDC055903]
MRHRISLPESLGPRFSVREAADRGIARRRTEARDLHRPFHGVRSTVAGSTFRDRVLDYLPRLRARQSFGGRTAARLWGLPHPKRWSPSEDLVIVVDPSMTPPRTRGVEGRRLRSARYRRWNVGEAPVVDPVAAVFMCAADLTRDQLTIMLDAILSAAPNYPGLLAGRPNVSPDEIRLRLDEWGRFAGCRRVRDALDRAREGVESPKETTTRLALIDAGLPEPAVQHQVTTEGRFVARVDLAYVDAKIAIEYEGDGHRTSKEQWRTDIARQRELERLGWIVIRITEQDLTHGALPLVSAVTAALAARG